MTTEKILKYLIYLGVAVLLYVPFIVANEMFFPYITGKAYTFRIVTEIIIGLWAILAVLYPIYRPRKSWLAYTFGVFLGLTLISNLLGVNIEASIWSNFERMEGWVTLAHLFGLFLALGSVLRDKKEWIWLFNASIVASLFMVASAFGQVFEKGFNVRVDTTLGNSTYLGIYMLMNAFLSLFLLLRQKINLKSWPIYFYGITFILQVIVAFQTGTRGSMLGILGGLFLMALLMAILNKENKIFRRIAFTTVGAVIIFVGAIFLLKDTSLIQNIQPLKRITTISPTEGTAKARITNWQIAIEGFKERPVFGWGQSNFNYVFDKHYLPEHHGNEAWFDRVHNIFFDWLIAGGILGLLSYLSIWLALIWLIFITKNLSPNEKSVLIALLAGYFFHNLFVFDQIVSYIYFVFILAFVYSQSTQNTEPYNKEISPRLKNLLVSLIIILIPVSIYCINYQSYAANLDLIEAIKIVKTTPDGKKTYHHENGIYGNIESFESALERDTFANSEIRQRVLLLTNEIFRIENLDDSIKQQYLQFVTDKMNQQIKEDPQNSRYPYLFGSFFGQIGQAELSERFLLQAIELSPNKQAIRIPLIKLYYATDQGEKAVALAKETYELDTSKDDIWAEYISVVSKFDKESVDVLVKKEISEGNLNRVEKLLMKNISDNPENINSVISLSAFYFSINDTTASVKVIDQAIEDFPNAVKQLEKLKTQIEAGENPLGQSF